MGWLFGHHNRKSLIEHLVRGNGVITHAHCLRGNNLWAVQEYQKKKFIALYLLRGRDGECGWGYKDMDESMGPYYYNCPLKYLDMADEPSNETAREWREIVRKKHAEAVERRKQNSKKGARVEWGGRQYELLEPIGRGNWKVFDTATGDHYRMKRKQLEGATPCLATS